MSGFGQILTYVPYIGSSGRAAPRFANKANLDTQIQSPPAVIGDDAGINVHQAQRTAKLQRCLARATDILSKLREAIPPAVFLHAHAILIGRQGGGGTRILEKANAWRMCGCARVYVRSVVRVCVRVLSVCICAILLGGRVWRYTCFSENANMGICMYVFILCHSCVFIYI